MPAPALIHELVERFDRNRDAYRSGQYNETQARREFIDPFFEALGWDVNNRQGYAEAYKDVIHEDAIKIGGATKAPDYCFRIGGMRKFFVEAKKPSVKLRDDISAAFQLRRYAWSAKLPLSLLTDFDEFAIYDCRGKPDKGDKPSAGRVLMLDYSDYLARWDEIAGIFSREAILRGSFDKYAESVTGKHGTAEVDDAFLREIEGWRDTLARTIALRNPALGQRALNTAVQATIDRIVFLRICEDRGIEGYGTLLALTNGGDIYARLADLFRQADARYNSGLFHFASETDRPETPDAWTLGLAIDDKPLREILRGLYYPDSPYEFAVLPADILGQVYEQFLGQVIRLTSGHRAVVEAKPEVKKAGGVFYTPTFIVRVIVRRTVGPLLAGKTVREVAGRGGVTPPLRIADIACGSGTFLLEVYQYLLDWYLEQYVTRLTPLLQAGHTATSPEVRAQLPEDAAPAPKRGRKTDGSLPIYEAAGGEWRLTTAERKRILTTHIYGVDIDPQAVEVTKLSLLLKVLEGESEQTLGSQLRLFQERALPDLARNIKCGNSLIGPEFDDGQQLGLLDDDERYRINAFDWVAEFPEVFRPNPPAPFPAKEGGADAPLLAGEGLGVRSVGFDAIVGNPPYIRIQTMKEWAPLEVEYYKRAYAAAGKGNYDIYVVFVERALQLLNPRGRLGFILPHKFFNAQYGEPLRGLLAGGRHLAEVVHFGDQQVFHNATTYTCLLFLDRAGRDEFRFERVADLATWREAREADPSTAGVVSTAEVVSTAGAGLLTTAGAGLLTTAGAGLLTVPPPATAASIPADRATAAEWNFTVGAGAALFEKLRAMPVKLGDVAHTFVGTQTSADDVFVLEGCRIDGDYVIGRSKSLERDVRVEIACTQSFLRGKQIRRYEPPTTDARLICPYEISASDFRLLSVSEISAKYPLTLAYLESNKPALAAREKGKFKGQNWYAFGYPKSMTLFQGIKIIVPDYNNAASFSLDSEGHFYKTGYGVLVRDPLLSSLYVLGLLNSPLLFRYLLSIGTMLRGGYVRFWTQYIEQLPIRPINFADPADVARHDRMVALVEAMLDLHRKLAAAVTDQEQAVLRRQIVATDRLIDRLVYELYGLTEEEVGIVESGG